MREGEPQFEADILDRETPLSVDEIANARGPEEKIFPSSVGKTRYEYYFGDISVSILRKGIAADDFEKNKERILAVLKSKEEGEILPCEKLLVNALVEQYRIAKMFGIKETEVWSSLLADYTHEGSSMMSYMGDEVYMLSLAQHIDSLKKEGATNEQVITEISGQIFHESIHNGKTEISGHNSPFGEVTPITGQLAYYLAKRYRGPKGYDAPRSLLGLKKIESSENPVDLAVRDHDIATCLSAELLLEGLTATYPEIAKDIKLNTALDACEELIARIPVEKGDSLIPCLKGVIVESTNENKLREVVKKLKEQNEKKS